MSVILMSMWPGFHSMISWRASPGHEGKLPTMADWEDHITTAFPEVRLKSYLEMRGADGGPWNMICALPALWTGLFMIKMR